MLQKNVWFNNKHAPIIIVDLIHKFKTLEW